MDIQELTDRASEVALYVEGAGDIIAELRQDLAIAQKRLDRAKSIANDNIVEWMRKHGDIPLGGGKWLAFSYAFTTEFRDLYGALEAIMDAAEVPQKYRERLGLVLSEVSSKAKTGPFLKTGLASFGIDTDHHYRKVYRKDSAGEPLCKVTVKDKKYSKKEGDS